LIDFDHDVAGEPLAAPAVFSLTQPLTGAFAPWGVTFSGGYFVMDDLSFGTAVL
jgi:hypothetical protein